MISLAMMAALALATWSVRDPSLSHATDAPVHNLLGRPGAIGADLTMQCSAWARLPCCCRSECGATGCSAIAGSAARSCAWCCGYSARFSAPRSHRASRKARIGRCRAALAALVGDAMLRLPTVTFHIQLVGANRLAAAIVLGIAALVSFAGAAGIIWHGASEDDDADTEDEDDEDEAAAADDDGGWTSLGWMMHAVLSLRAQFTRLLRWRPRALPVVRSDVTMPRRRIEPRFDSASAPERYVEDAEVELVPDAEPRAPRKPRAPKPRRSSSGYQLPPLETVDAAEQDRPRYGEQRNLQTNATALEACSAISASAAKSSMRGRGRWSRSTNSNPRPA